LLRDLISVTSNWHFAARCTTDSANGLECSHS
jgi:hypothetical protein